MLIMITLVSPPAAGWSIAFAAATSNFQKNFIVDFRSLKLKLENNLRRLIYIATYLFFSIQSINDFKKTAAVVFMTLKQKDQALIKATIKPANEKNQRDTVKSSQKKILAFSALFLEN